MPQNIQIQRPPIVDFSLIVKKFKKRVALEYWLCIILTIEQINGSKPVNSTVINNIARNHLIDDTLLCAPKNKPSNPINIM